MQRTWEIVITSTGKDGNDIILRMNVYKLNVAVK